MRGDDFIGRKRANDHHNRKHGNDERNLVAEHLRDRTHRAEHREFVVASPARHEHSELRCRSHSEEKQNAAVDHERSHVPAIRNHAEGENRRRRNQDRREKMHNLVRTRRHNVLLDQHFNPVGDWLKKTERPDPIWPVAILYPPKNFPLQHGNEREERQEHTEQRENVDETRTDLNQPIRRMCQWREQPLLCVDENLIDGVAAHVG